MGFRWLTKKELDELERQQRAGDKAIASVDWVKIARDAELRREAMIQAAKDGA